jgi:type I restriction enzyme R subunit
MQDHGLFQAICRTNRLDSEDKDFGYIVDYKDLFKKLVNEKGTGALQVYTSELDHSAGGADPAILLQDRLEKGRERLDNAIEALALLCEPVQPPGGELEHIHYFCGNTELPTDLQEREPQRMALYKATVALVRAYANLADDLEPAGYSPADMNRIKAQLKKYLGLRETIRNASGESLDLKAYEADMRHLIDTYIEASEPRKISPFDGMGLLELIVQTGIGNAIGSLPDGLKANKNAVAETIENNVRSKITREHLNDPNFYARMSALLEEIIQFRKEKADKYEEYLRRIADLARQLVKGFGDSVPEPLTKSPALRALYSNLKTPTAAPGGAHHAAEAGADYIVAGDATLGLALKIDAAVKTVRPNAWRGVQPKENVIKAALLPLLGSVEEVERIFAIIKQQAEY